jgi:methyltransferase (TIGR00027 family)
MFSMADSLIRDVSDTAFMVAAYRAIETQRSDALFRDPLAEKLAGRRGQEIVANLPRRVHFGKWFVAIRTHVIDGLLEAAIAEGVDLVLNLGAGLDTRPYRMKLPPSLRWVEVDYPKIVDLKERILAAEKPRCRLERVRLDLADVPARRQLLTEIAGEAHKVLVLTEGVIPYLSAEEVASLAGDLRQERTFVYWIIDYLSPEARRYRKRVEKKMNMENAPFRFDPIDYFGFFVAHGWNVKDVRYIPEEAQKLNRAPEIPVLLRWKMRFGRIFAAGRLKESFLKSVAYALLERSGAA